MVLLNNYRNRQFSYWKNGKTYLPGVPKGDMLGIANTHNDYLIYLKIFKQFIKYFQMKQCAFPKYLIFSACIKMYHMT